MTKKLLIIDGNAIVHRAFHAYPPLTRKDGKLIGAVYGFFAMLIKVIEEIKPQYLVITFDRPAPTFRKLLYAGYQAQRPQMADGLSEQITLLHEALAIAGIPVFEIDGYEADDVIGTIAKESQKSKIKSQKLETVILSGDRDLLQLVNEYTKVLIPIVGITKFTLYDEQKVEEKFGVKSPQFVDYKAFIGDASDGYPGVNGIGSKTASSLIKKYDSFENVYHHISELPEKIALKLATDAEQAALAKKLATIATDVPVTLDLAACSLDLFTREKMEAVCDLCEFTSLRKRLGVFGEKEKDEKQLELL